MISSKSDISDLSSTGSLINLQKYETMNTSVSFKNPEPVEYCLTKFNFEASKNDELSFKANQYIRVTKKVDGGWWEGKLDERIGWFPTDFVTLEIEPHKIKELIQNDKVLTTEEISVLRYKNIVFNRSQLPLSDLSPSGIEISESEFVRNEITKDLIHSEEAYIEDITSFTNQIIKPLENETWISHADHNDMFGRIPWLSNLHICLTSELKSALNHPEEKSLGNCFSCVIQNFEIVYSDYFSSCPRAIYIASQYSANDKMTTFLVNAGCQSLPPILHIITFLHKPIQRITRYSPVISELLHFTKPEDPGFDELVDMVTKFKHLEEYLKTLKVNAEKQERLKNLYNSIEDWVGPGIENYGELLLESKVHILDPSSSSTTPKTHYIYLLEKLFVILKPSSKSDNVKYNLVVSVPVWKGTLNIIHDANEMNSFQVIFLPSEQSSKVKTLLIFVSKPEVKKQWVETVRKQLEKNVRLTLPSLPANIERDLSAIDSTQSKKKWKKLVTKFAKTKGKNENTLPPYTSSNLLLKTSEGGTLISSTLSNLEHKIITEEKRKQGELLKMKYQEMERNEESGDSPIFNEYPSSSVATQGYNTTYFENLPTMYDTSYRTSTSSTSTCSSSSSKMTTICTKYNSIERNTYSYDNTSSYSEGTAYNGVNNSMNMNFNNLQMTKMYSTEEEEEANEEFDMMMGNDSSDEEEEEEEQEKEQEQEQGEEINKENFIKEPTNVSHEPVNSISMVPELCQEETVDLEKSKNVYMNDVSVYNTMNMEDDKNSCLDDSVNNAGMIEQNQLFIDHCYDSNIMMNDQDPVPSVQPTIEASNSISEANNSFISASDLDLEKLSLRLKKKDSYETFISEDMKSFDTNSIRQLKTTTWYSGDSKSETEELKRSVKNKDAALFHNNKENIHKENGNNSLLDFDDIHKETGVNILLELEELEKRNNIRKREISEVSSITSLKSVQMITKQMLSIHEPDEYHSYSKLNLTPPLIHYSPHYHVEDDEKSETLKEEFHQNPENKKLGSKSGLVVPTIHNIYKNKNIVKEDLSTLLSDEDQYKHMLPPLVPIGNSIEENEKEEFVLEEPELLSSSETKQIETLNETDLLSSSELNQEVVALTVTKSDLLSSSESKPEVEVLTESNLLLSEPKQNIKDIIKEQSIDGSSLSVPIENKDSLSKMGDNNESNSESILNNIIKEKIAQEIKEKCGDISNKDLTIKIHINEENNSNDINIEIKINNRTNEDKIPAVTVESESISSVATSATTTTMATANEEESSIKTTEFSSPTPIENYRGLESCGFSDDKEKVSQYSDVKDQENENSLHSRQSSFSPTTITTIATEATDATLSVISNEEDKLHSPTVDPCESKCCSSPALTGYADYADTSLETIIQPKQLFNHDSSSIESKVVEEEKQEEQPQLSKMKKFHKNPFFYNFSPLNSYSSLPSDFPFSVQNEDRVFGYGLLEKQFKFFLNRNHLHILENNTMNRYSDSFIHYQNVDFKKKEGEDLVMPHLEEKEKEPITLEKKSISNTTTTLNEIINKNKENTSLFLNQKRLPKTFLSNSRSQANLSTTLRSLSDTYVNFSQGVHPHDKS